MDFTKKTQFILIFFEENQLHLGQARQFFSTAHKCTKNHVIISLIF